MPAAHEECPAPAHQSWWRSRRGAAFAVLLGIALVFLLLELRVHLLGAWPYLLVLACPLLHLFHHRGHGGHRPQSQREQEPRA